MESMSTHIKSPTDNESGEENFDLPEEIILDILLRLPVKSILKFRCVSKSWLSLISSQLFIETHVRVSTENSKLNGHKLIFTVPYSPSDSDQMQCSVRSLLCEQPLTDTLNIDYPMKHPPMHIWMVGSCNGLICIAENIKDLFLWNPSIRKTKRVPSMDLGQNIYNYVAYGFGFDDDDYKIVGIFSVSEERRYKYIMMVYGLRSDSWKRVGELEGGIPLPNSIKFASGKLHWWASPDIDTHCKRDIVCLDLKSGTYGTVEQPDYERDYVNRTLGVLGGCICVLGDSGDNIDLWILKECGVTVRGSWSKVSHFPCIQSFSLLLKPLCLLPNGEILLVNGSSFIVCNPRCSSFTVLKSMKLQGRFFDVDIFVESLVSPGAE
ncbi:F-box/kelch-repeat protein At3g06240-like [Primulina eburnea]|uniref:F-box/kelch-repeat protein At3g06240-like n=1 Tax=Primulina eburnea TaxID=1245227 RepID=UPI003C6CC2F3